MKKPVLIVITTLVISGMFAVSAASARRWEIGFRLLSRGVALPGGCGWHGEHAADHQRGYYNQYRFFHGAILV